MNKQRLIPLLLLLVSSTIWAKGVYQTPKQYLLERQGSQSFEASTLWMTPELKAGMSEILSHEYRKTRVKFWRNHSSTIWLLDEIGKEKPISFGVHIVDNQIIDIKVLAFRETRGDEIRHSFFSKQFLGVTLAKDNQLSEHIDGITGATYSVRAMTKVARLALWLDAKVRDDT